MWNKKMRSDNDLSSQCIWQRYREGQQWNFNYFTTLYGSIYPDMS